MVEIARITLPKEKVEKMKEELERYTAGTAIAIVLKVWKSGDKQIVEVSDMGLKAGDEIIAIHLGEGQWLLIPKKENKDEA